MRRLLLLRDPNGGADRFVFAAGPWLPKLFPEVIGDRIQPTRQEVFFFAPPAGDPLFQSGRMPGAASACAEQISLIRLAKGTSAASLTSNSAGPMRSIS